MKHNYAEGPRPEGEREYSETSSREMFDNLLKRVQSHSLLGGTLEDINRSEEKKEIIERGLNERGYTWMNLSDLSEKPEAALAFGRLIAFWDHRVDGKPKTDEQHDEEVRKFTALL